MRKRVIVVTVLTLLFDFCERTVYRQAESSPRLFLWTLRACCKTTPIHFCFNLIENHSKLRWLFFILVRLTGFGLFSLTWYFFFSMCSFLHVCGHSSFFRHVCLRILWHLVEHSYELATQHAGRLVFFTAQPLFGGIGRWLFYWGAGLRPRVPSSQFLWTDYLSLPHGVFPCDQTLELLGTMRS